MARYYKTSSANPVDYMYRIPSEMMMRVLQNEDAQINNILNSADLYNNTLLQVPYLSQHADKIKEKQKYYNDKTNEISKAILEGDAGSWRKYQGPIKDIGRELQEDMLTGDLSKIRGNYDKMQKAIKEIEELDKRGMKNGVGYSKKDLEMQLSAMTKDYTGYDEDGKIKNIPIEGFSKLYNFPEYYSKIVDKMKEDGIISKEMSKDGVWDIITGKEGLNRDKIIEYITTYSKNDPEFMQSLMQRNKYGLPGYNVLDDNGNLKLFKEVKKKDDKGVEYTTYEPEDNYMSGAIFSVGDGRSWLKTKNDYDMNPVSAQMRGFAQQEKMAAIGEKYKIAGEKRQAERDLETSNRAMLEYQQKTAYDMLKSSDPSVRQLGMEMLSGVNKTLYREEEHAFNKEQLTPHLNRYVDLLGKSNKSQDEVSELQDLEGMFIPIKEKYNISEEDLRDFISYENFLKLKKDGSNPGYKWMYKLGQQKEIISKYNKFKDAKTNGNSLIDEIVSDINVPSNPFMVLSPNTPIGMMSTNNILNGLQLKSNYSVYSSGVNHRGANGQLLPGNNNFIKVDRDTDKDNWWQFGMSSGPSDWRDIERNDIVEVAKQISKETGIPLSNLIKVKTQRAESNQIVSDIELILPEGYNLKEGSTKAKVVLKRGAENMLPLLQDKNLQNSPDYGDFQRTFSPNFDQEYKIDYNVNLLKAGKKTVNGDFNGVNYKLNKNQDGTYNVIIGDKTYTKFGENPIQNLEQIKAILNFSK